MSFEENLPKSFFIRSDWIWTGEGLPIADSCIHIQNDQIVSVSSDVPPTAINIGAFCILPSLINSHTHLEFSNLKQPVCATGSFAEWILNVVQQRRFDAQLRPDEASTADSVGLTESQSYAVRLALDVVHGNIDDASKSRSKVPHSNDSASSSYSVALPTIVRFAELMGTTPLREQQTWRGALTLKRNSPRLPRDTKTELTLLATGLGNKNNFKIFSEFGLSPHAPYTTTARLIRRAVEKCRRWNVPIMMHLAESREELQWTEKGVGPLQELLELVAGPDVLSSQDRLPIAGYVNELCKAPLALIIHGNYLDDASMAILAAHRHHAAVVYCPRTHAHFGHTTHPIIEMHRKGIPILLGTDSRASNPDLSIFAEARFVRKVFPDLAADEILSMVTTRPADLLGCTKSYGYIRPGSLDRLTAIACQSTQARDVLDDLLESDNRPQPLEVVRKAL